MTKSGSKVRAKRPKAIQGLEEPRWMIQSQFLIVTARDDGMKLAVGVGETPDRAWAVTAIETPSGSLEGIFEHHGHKILGEYSFNEAITAAESYAKAWLKGHKVAKIEACECDEIVDAEFEDVEAVDAENVEMRS
jgi:hypothetical protein